ncbi:MAG TPA: hypothetical protein VLG76_01050 [Rhabdochlamydiaceae bacterium]|nr:hypothetical protein [Rhabdochlamydiaceae bacterium]
MQKDYIMRIIEQFVQAILSIFRARVAGKYDEAINEIRRAGRYYLKTDLSLISYYSPDQLLNHFKDEDERAIFCAELLHELALVNQAQKNEEESIRLKILCLHLYAAVIPKEEQFQVPKYFDKADALVEELKNEQLPASLLTNYNALKKRISNE